MYLNTRIPNARRYFTASSGNVIFTTNEVFI